MGKKIISKLWAVCLQNGVSFVKTNEQHRNRGTHTWIFYICMSCKYNVNVQKIC
jgi:hypothetical protein